MQDAYLIGLDFGTASARGVLVEIASGQQVAHLVHKYRHGVLQSHLPSGVPLPPDFALQVPADYLEAAQTLLSGLGRDRSIAGIGVDFTACTPLPAKADGTALAEIFPDAPHAYAKLWKHGGAHRFAAGLNERSAPYLANFGGALSGEWLIPKAAELRALAPDIWAATQRLIEAGDWLVWNLNGTEARSMDFACFKAQYSAAEGYPRDVVEGLESRQSPPMPPGSRAGALTEAWRQKTGIKGAACIAVAVIDSHAALPATGSIAPGTLVGSLGTSAGFLLLDKARSALPPGLEGAAFGAALPDLWCCEAGQAAFGDTLAWFLDTFPRHGADQESFDFYNGAAAELSPGESGLLALDWFGGNRVPFRDGTLSGALLGLRLGATAPGIYRALVESLCFGARSIVELAESGGIPVKRVLLTSGLADSNRFVVQMMANVLGRVVEMPALVHAAAVGAAIHGSVAAGVVKDFDEGARRFGARSSERFEPDREQTGVYDVLFSHYLRLAHDPAIRDVMHQLNTIHSAVRKH